VWREALLVVREYVEYPQHCHDDRRRLTARIQEIAAAAGLKCPNLSKVPLDDLREMHRAAERRLAGGLSRIKSVGSLVGSLPNRNAVTY